MTREEERQMREGVKKGVKLLDEIAPNWREKVSTTLLDMRSYDSCLLAQIFGSYIRGLSAISEDKVTPATKGREREYGFRPYYSFNTSCQPWDFLTSLWKEEL